MVKYNKVKKEYFSYKGKYEAVATTQEDAQMEIDRVTRELNTLQQQFETKRKQAEEKIKILNTKNQKMKL